MRNTQAHKTQFIAVFGEISACHSSDRHAGYKNFLQYDAWYKGSTAHILGHKGAWECDVASLWPNKQLPPPPVTNQCLCTTVLRHVHKRSGPTPDNKRSHTRQHDQLHRTQSSAHELLEGIFSFCGWSSMFHEGIIREKRKVYTSSANLQINLANSYAVRYWAMNMHWIIAQL